MSTDYSVEAPVVSGRLTIAQIEELVAKPMDTKPDKKFYLALTISGSALLIGAVCLLYTFYYGIGMWGNNQPVAWGFGIVNFVFWVGIGHAGTLISAILFLIMLVAFVPQANAQVTFSEKAADLTHYFAKFPLTKIS